MRRTATRLDNKTITIGEFKEKAFFNVFETQAAHMNQYGEWVKTDDRKALIREDGSYVSTVGTRYSIVDNQDFFERTIEKLNANGIEYQPKQVFVEGNGKRTTMVVKLPQFSIYPNSDEQQDFELRIRNSFDTTLSADALIGLLRLICTNGMTAFDVDFSMKIRHKGDILQKITDSLELYRDFEAVAMSNKARIEYMGNTNGSKRDVIKYIGDGEQSLNTILKGPRWASKLQERWFSEGQSTNLWDIYNMFTYIISHEFGHNYTSKLASMEALNKEVGKWDNLLGVNNSNNIVTIDYKQAV